jgi:hypothetical protein
MGRINFDIVGLCTRAGTRSASTTLVKPV